MKVLLLLLTMSLTSVAISQTNPWALMAANDLDAIHTILTEDHPGYVDSQNPWFKQQVEDGYRIAKSKINTIENFTDYKWVLSAYANRFYDGHLGIYFVLAEKEQPYPEFIVRYQNQRFIIAQSDNPTKIPVGSDLISCDGIPVKKIMLDYVAPIRGGDLSEESFWYTKTPYLLQGALPSWKTPFKSCVFRYNNKESTIELTYSTLSEQVLRERLFRLFGKHKSFTLSYLNPNIAWIQLPIFHVPNTELQAMRQIIEKGQNLRKLNYVIFDLRGNTGGDSIWGMDLLSAIYGKSYIDGLANTIFKETYVERRVSKNNLNYMRNTVLPYLNKEHGADSESAVELSDLINRMDDAVKNNKHYVIEHDASTNKPSITKPASEAIPVFITDGFCGSACLDFLDVGLKLPRALQLGLPTGGDTTYLDLAIQSLPSALAEIHFAMKVYRHRPRGSNQVYQPSIFYPDNIADDKSLKEWVLKKVLPQ